MDGLAGDHRMRIYTDGACDPNPGFGGWAFHIPANGTEGTGFEPDTTNNRMELMGILEGLRATKGAVTIYTDSQLSVNILTGRWRAKKNRDLIHDIMEQAKGRPVQYRWVRGHNGNRHNEYADWLAGEAMRLGIMQSTECGDDVLTAEWRSIIRDTSAPV